jgi:hypothetical protein
MKAIRIEAFGNPAAAFDAVTQVVDGSVVNSFTGDKNGKPTSR